jgi:hypothetical protein
MNKIVLDAELLAKLRGLTKSVEFADEHGNVIGSFVPNEAFERIMSFILSPATEEEIAEARAEMLATGNLKDGVSTAEILAGLKEIQRQQDERP